MKKRIASIFLFVAILFSFTACGNKNSSAKSIVSESIVDGATEDAAFAVSENCISDTIEFMKGYDYVEDIGISVDENEHQINIAVQVPDSINPDYIHMVGEDSARYLASQVSFSTELFSAPETDNIGTLYDAYILLVKVYSASGKIDEMGAATSSRKITW